MEETRYETRKCYIYIDVHVLLYAAEIPDQWVSQNGG